MVVIFTLDIFVRVQYDILLLILRKGINIAYYSICIAWNKVLQINLKKCCICFRKLKGSVAFY